MDRSVRAFVCGHPVGHSRSPLIHGFWLSELGIDGSYIRVERDNLAFPSFLRGFEEAGFAGGNITLPHKEAAAGLCGRIDETARLIGAVNTVWLDGDTGEIAGMNTDTHGFSANLDERAPGWDRCGSAIVLGAGGAARAVIHALGQRGIADIRIVNRTVERAVELKHRFGAHVSAHPLAALSDLLGDSGLLVNTTSLGMEGGAEDATPDLALLPKDAIVTDIVYAPLVTPLLAAASDLGLKTVDGLGMLLHQAAPGFALWFGARPVVSNKLREMIEQDISR